MTGPAISTEKRSAAATLEDVLPLTALQEAIVYHSTRPRPESITDPYLIVARLDLAILHGDSDSVDTARLHEAVATVTARHASLRTSYTRRRSGAPVARVHTDAAPRWRTVDVASAADIEALVEAERVTGIDLTAPSAMRWIHVRGPVGAGLDTLILLVHHVALDGWSIHRVLAEVVAAHRGTDLGEVAPVGGFLGWLGTRDTSADVAAWTAALADLDEPCRVLSAHGRTPSGIGPAAPAAVTDRPVTRRMERLGTERSTALRKLARDAGVTLNTVIQALWALVLADRTDRDDVVFGAVVSGRDPMYPAVDAIVGMLVNTVPVRVRLDPRETVAALLTRVQREQMGLVAHHHAALADIQSAVGLGELFDTLVVFESFPRGEVRPQIEDENTYPATLLVEDDPNIGFLLEQRADDAAPSGLLDDLLDVVGALLADPTVAIGRLTRAQTPAGGAVAGPSAADYASLSARIAAGAARDPQRTAVRIGDETVTYGDLIDRADRLAGALAARGIGPETTVALLLPRGIDAVLTLVAVVRRGAAYLPLDPGHPGDRIAFMLDDAAPELVVDVDEYARLAADAQTRPAADPSIPHMDSAAYLIYTSGSTGTPKGVVGTARALDNRIAWAADAWDGSVVLAKSSFAFIDGTTEILGALVAGATVVLADDATAADASALTALALEGGVRQITAVPSLASAMVDAAGATSQPGTALRPDRWIVSGEPLPGPTAALLAGAAGELINSYGSSEVAGDVSTAVIAPDAGEVTVGTPVPGTSLRVLDRRLRPVPGGVAGELYVGGVQVGRGYHGRAGLTATAFLADPVEPGSRMYRTGDRAMIGADGSLTLLGRLDAQVKIRGHRVEIGEVEAAVLAVDGVDEVVVAAGTDPTGDTRLDAYILGSADVDAVASALATRLPRHMIPATWTPLTTMPRTPGGKVDRRSLPAPAERRAAHRAAVTDNEKIVVETVSAVLGRTGDDSVGLDDHFFDLGGNSLSATRVLTRLRVATGTSLTVADIFEHPTPAGIAALLDPDGPPNSGAATAAAEVAPSADEPTPVSPRPEVLPLSPAQRRLYFQAGIDDSAYTVPFAVRLQPAAAVDADRLQRALDGVISRHEVLRTRIVDGAQIIDATADVPVARHDLPGNDTEVDELVDGLTAQFIARPFDLADEPPLRADLLRTADAAILLITVHHIAADEWSAQRLFEELATDYNAGGDGGLRAPDVQFADHTLWQLARLGDAARPGSLAHGQIGFWRERLAGAPAELALPYDRPRGADRDHRGGQVEVLLDPTTLRRTRTRGRAAGASPFMTVHAAVALALSASGAGNDIVVGTPIAGRTTVAADALIGMFVNTLALRTDLSGNPTLGDVLDRVRRVDLDAYAHADIGFDDVVAALAPERSLGRHPVFQTMVQYRDPIIVPTFEGLRAEPVFPESTTAKFDLTFEFVELADDAGIRLRVEYATELFDEDTVAALTDRVVAALDALVTAPDTRVADLRLAGDVPAPLSETDHPATAADSRTLLDVVDEVIARHPTRPAVHAAGQTLTYGELDTRSAALAGRLVADGVRPGDLVALRMSRGADLVVAVLGTLRAGAAYVPIDPEYPAERIAMILEDATPSAVVDDEYVASAASRAHPRPDGVVELTPDHPAYVIFTSGSTGRPKGVRVTHANVVSLLDSTRGLFTFDEHDVWTLFHSYAFDFSVWELWGPLSTGAALVVPDRTTVRSPDEFADTLVRHGVTVLNQTPTAFFALDAATGATDRDTDPFATVRYIVFGGEALDLPRLAPFAEAHPTVRLVNMYGITETTVHASHIRLDPATLADAPGSDVGALLPGFSGHLLDDYLRPVADGVTGELYLSGRQVASGYLGRAGLTATRFVAGADGSVMYRSGDLFRRTASGALLYAGRADTQVKIRGFRIELGEIRSALAEIDGVRDVAVITRPGSSGADRILGFVVGDGLTGDSVRAAVATRLPEHMVPAAIGVVDAIPVTVNGKTDASALPDPDTADTGGRRPSGTVEELLAEVFADSLGLDLASVGADDDFFALGGDSIVSTTMVNRARRRGVRISPRDVFAHRTIAGLATVAETIDTETPATAVSDTGVSDTGASSEWSGAAPLAAQPVALLPVMHRLREFGGRIDRFNQSLVVDTPAGADTARIAAALQVVLDSHPALRMSLTVVAGSVWTLTANAPGSLDAANLLVTVPLPDGGDIAEVVGRESDAAAARLAPAEGVMVAATFLRPETTDGTGRLILVIHHLAVDGVSRRIILDDLAAVDAALVAGADAAAAASSDTTGPAVYADAVNARAADPALYGEVEHWAQVLAPGGELVPGVPPTGGVVGDLRRTVVTLDAESTRSLLTDLPAALGVGVTSVMLGALRVAAQQVFGTGDLVVDTERHGRDTEAAGLPDVDLSHTVGWFTTVAPLRLPAGTDHSPAAVVDAIREADRRWNEMPSAGAGFGMLRFLNPQLAAALAGLGRASVLLNYLGRIPVGGGIPWRPSAESAALAATPDADLGCGYPLEIDIVCKDLPTGPELSATFAYLPTALDADDVSRLAHAWRTVLVSLCSTSDFGVSA